MKLLFRLIFFCLIVLSVSCTNKPALFFTYLHTNPEKDSISIDSVNILQNAHLDNISRLAEEGILLAAGPFAGGGGILILQSNTAEEVNDILNSDPAIAAGRFKTEIHPIKIESGKLNRVDSNYTMTSYHFIQLGNSPEPEGLSGILRQDSLVLVSRIRFTDNNKSLLLIKGLSDSINNLSRLNRIFPPEETELNKILWIAKESFE